jgi:hypothetical protein
MGKMNENHKLRIDSKNIPKGPYKTQAERWNALNKLLDLKILRDKHGLKAISSKKLSSHMGMPYEEIHREIYSDKFQSWRLARASVQIKGILSDIAPTLRTALLGLAQEIERAEAIGERDTKKSEKFTELVSSTMDRFGIQKVDSSQADIMEEIDVHEAIQEGRKIVKELTGVEVIVQKFINVCSNETAKSGGKDGPTGGDSATHKDDAGDKPDPVVLSASLPKTLVLEPKKISVDDRF